MTPRRRPPPDRPPVFITGGSKGIGRACATAFAERGHPVAATWNRGPAPEPIDGVLDVRCDVRDDEAVQAAVAEAEEHHGPALVAVANAGIMRNRLVPRMDEATWLDVIDTNLNGAYRLAHATLPAMMSARWGRVVLVSSAGAQTGYRGQANYIASKTGLTGLARTISREWAARGITANVVAPGLVPTEMTAGLERWDEIAEHIPLGRTGTAEEIAAVVRWLASPEAAYVSGAIIPVDGGISMGWVGPS